MYATVSALHSLDFTAPPFNIQGVDVACGSWTEASELPTGEGSAYVDSDL
jgi:hypothetical protein